MSEKSSKTVDIKSSWDRTLSVLRAELGEATFRSWFKHIEFGELNEKKLVLYVPTKFMKDWIHTHYSDRILSILKNDILGHISFALLSKSIFSFFIFSWYML